MDAGLLDGSVVTVTFPRFYDDNPDKEVSVMVYDRFFLKDVNATSANTQRFEFHPIGRQKLTYRPTSIVYVVDSTGKVYSMADYTIQNGQLVWTSNNRPNFDPEINKGAVVAIRYKYQPYFYCTRLIHEVRIGQQEVDFETGGRKSIRLPYEALLAR